MRGALAPFLRDTLVGFNYMHYAPPGAQVLHTNPLFVRSHDFIGMQGANQTWKATECSAPAGPSNAGGRLVGSLAALPYALAEAEQNFLIPSHEQALIWGDLVPQMILSAVVPRWWNVSPLQIHWVGLHMAYAEIAAGGKRARTRSAGKQVMAALDRVRAAGPPAEVERLLAVGRCAQAAWKTSCRRRCICWRTELAISDRDSPLAQEIRRLAAAGSPKLSPRGDLARVRHAQADAGEFLSAGAAEPAHLPDADGILQPHPGGELGIESAVLRRAGGRDPCAPGAD